MSQQENPYGRTWRLSPDLLGICNKEGFFIQTNPAWQTTLGWSEAEIHQKPFREFVHPDDLERTLEVFKGMQTGKPALHFENRYRCKDGAYRWLSWVAVQEGDVFVCNARDITDDKARAKEIKQIENEAKLRDQFVAILSHDLRNPLAAIRSAVQIAGREPQSERTSAMLSSINGSVDRIADLIDDTLDFTRARLGAGIPVEFSDCSDLKEKFQQVVTEARLSNPDREIVFDFDFDHNISCDSPRLSQILSNLLGNAIAHGSPDDPVFVSLSDEDEALNLLVRNTGETIPEDALPTLFEPFVRLNDGTSSKGLGLGLYIADQIARAHRGWLEVSSKDGETEFRFKMPLSHAQ